ncbi:MAG: stress response translation initiation inhibitor YciH [bacterium]|nr:stress response translation initiation inhibitor YciH [bacterium]
MRDDRELVYSTETGYQAPPKRRESKPASGKQALPDDGVIRVARERRRGSMMSVVHGLAPGELDAIGKALKRHCGTGGTAKNGVVEIQGDHREKIVAWFAAQGRKAKLAGG